MRFLHFTTVLALLASSFASAETFKQDQIKFGKSSAGNKTVEFNIGSGSANPRLRWNNGDTRFEFALDGTTWKTPAMTDQIGLEHSKTLENLTVTNSVAASALTIALKTNSGTDPTAGDPTKVAFRSSTATSGLFFLRTITSALSVVLSSGSTLGHTSALDEFIWVYLIDNAGTPEFAIAGSNFVDEGRLHSTTAEGGAGAADSRSTLYSTTARTNVAVRLVARLKVNQAVAGTHGSTATEVSVMPFFAPLAGTVIGVAYNSMSAVMNGTTNTPQDNTIPQITEGTEAVAVSYTPKYKNSLLKITGKMHLSEGASNVADVLMFAAHRSDITDAIDVSYSNGTTANSPGFTSVWLSSTTVTLSETTSALTFSLRFGASAGANHIWVNSDSGSTARLYGGAAKATIVVEELAN